MLKGKEAWKVQGTESSAQQQESRGLEEDEIYKLSSLPPTPKAQSWILISAPVFFLNIHSNRIPQIFIPKC